MRLGISAQIVKESRNVIGEVFYKMGPNHRDVILAICCGLTIIPSRFCLKSAVVPSCQQAFVLA